MIKLIDKYGVFLVLCTIEGEEVRSNFSFDYHFLNLQKSQHARFMKASSFCLGVNGAIHTEPQHRFPESLPLPGPEYRNRQRKKLFKNYKWFIKSYELSINMVI